MVYTHQVTSVPWPNMQGEMNNIDEKTVTKTVVQCHRQCMELITWNEGGGGGSS